MSFAMLGGTSLPCSLVSFGLGSKVSTWLGPPPMNSRMTLLALPSSVAGANVPELDPLVHAGAGEGPAVRTESHAIDNLFVLLEGGAFPAGPCVPQFHHRVLAAGRHGAAVRVEAHRNNAEPVIEAAAYL